MRLLELFEGGWDSPATQKTKLTPEVVLRAEPVFDSFIEAFNKFLQEKNLPPVRKGSRTGSSAYAEKDIKINPNKEYGDIDRQMTAQNVSNGSDYQFKVYWNNLVDEFIKTGAFPAVDIPSSSLGKPKFKIGPNELVQIDLMWHEEPLGKWATIRSTPEHEIKGTIYGNMWSTTGEILDMSVQQAGVQFKQVNNQRVPFNKKTGTEVVTITTDPETWIMDIFNHEAKSLGLDPDQVEIDPLLQNNQGLSLDNIKIDILAKGIKGLARSFEKNKMFGQGALSKFSSADDFLNQWFEHFKNKSMKAYSAPKFNKATGDAIDRANRDKKSILNGIPRVGVLLGVIKDETT